MSRGPHSFWRPKSLSTPPLLGGTQGAVFYRAALRLFLAFSPPGFQGPLSLGRPGYPFGSCSGRKLSKAQRKMPPSFGGRRGVLACSHTSHPYPSHPNSFPSRPAAPKPSPMSCSPLPESTPNSRVPSGGSHHRPAPWLRPAGPRRRSRSPPAPAAVAAAVVKRLINASEEKGGGRRTSSSAAPGSPPRRGARDSGEAGGCARARRQPGRSSSLRLELGSDII